MVNQRIAKTRQRSPRGEGGRLRSEIIAAATRVLGNLGEEQPFSLRAVAKEAKIAAPSVYLHFQDKTELVLTVLETLFTELSDRRNTAEDRAAASGGGPWERLIARSVAYVEFGLQQPGHYKVLYEGRAVRRVDAPRVAALGQPMLDRTIVLVRELITAGETPLRIDDAERIGLLLWIGLHGVVSLQINKPTLDWPDANTLTRQIVSCVLRPMAF